MTVDITARVTAALAELGAEPDAVADSLRAKGIKGVQGLDHCCPIANYLGVVLHDPVTQVYVGVVEDWVEFAVGLGAIQRLRNPDAICMFVRNFDRGIYLDLVDGELHG